MIPAMIPAMSGLGNFEKNSGRKPLWPVAIIGMRTAGMANVVSLKTSESARSPLILTGLSILNLVSGYVPLIRKHWFVVTLLRFFQDPPHLRRADFQSVDFDGFSVFLVREFETVFPRVYAVVAR